MIDFNEERDLVQARLGGANILNSLMNAMKDARGIHSDSLLCVLGSLAGYACQNAVRYEYVKCKGMPEEKVFIAVKGEGNKTLLCGDMLNKPLAEDKYSVCSVVAGAAVKLGIENIWQKLDVNEIFKYNASVMFTDKYGIPRLPDGHGTSDTEENYVTALWSAFRPMALKFVTEDKLPLVFAFAAQEAVVFVKDALDPITAMKLVIESAVAMSKVTIKELGISQSWTSDKA